MNWNKFSSTYFLSGLSLALMMINILFNIPFNLSQIDWINISEYEMEEVEVVMPRTIQNNKMKLPPPITEFSLEEIVEEVEWVEELAEELSSDIIEEYVFESTPLPVEQAERPDPVFVPQEPEDQPEDIVFLAEKMPSWLECADRQEEADRRACTSEKLLKYIYDNLKYPAIAIENQIEGTVVIQYVVTKEGTVNKVKIVRDIGGGCGSAAVDVINSLPSWSPGSQNGRPVGVLYTIPIKFQIMD